MMPDAPRAPARRQPLVLVCDRVLSLLGVLAFVAGFLPYYSSDQGFGGFTEHGFSATPPVLLLAVLVGGFAAVCALARRAPSHVLLAVMALAAFAFEIGDLFTFSDFGDNGARRAAGYWLLFVVVVGQLLVAVTAALVETRLVTVGRRTPAAPPPGPPPHVAGPPFGPPAVWPGAGGGGFAPPPDAPGAPPPPYGGPPSPWGRP